MATWLIILVIGVPWLGALIEIIMPRRPTIQHGVAVLFSAAGAICALALLPDAGASDVISLQVGAAFGAFTFRPDGLGVFLAAIATVIGSLAVVFSIDYMKGETHLGRYYALVLLFIGAMAGLVLTNSLLLLFFFWEITALCSYALISFESDNPDAVRGGIKALVMTQIGGVGLMAGALAIYALTGSYQISDFLAGASGLPGSALGLLAFGFLIAAAAKSAQVPFHTWLPGAMEAPTPISALIHAATMVNAGVYLLARFFPAFEAVPGWKTTVMAVGVVTALLGALMAISANDLKRTLAYSTVSQLGYMVYAIGVGGLFASQFHLLSHAVFKALLFLGAGAVIHAAGTRDMREMGGLGRSMPLTRVVFIVGALALAGLPIFNGYFSKDLILESGLTGGPLWAYAVMLFGAGLTAFYSFRMVTLVFYGERHGTGHVHDAGPAMAVALVPLAVGTLSTWLLAGPFGHLLESTLPYHEMHVLALGELVTDVLKGSIVVLPVVLAGLLAWGLHKPLAGLGRAFTWLMRAAAADFGFEWINSAVVNAVGSAAGALRRTQTGLLNWNVAGMVFGLLAILLVLLLRAS